MKKFFYEIFLVEEIRSSESIKYLKRKIDYDRSQWITGLSFDNRFFYKFKEGWELAIIDTFPQNEIMSAVNRKQTERMFEVSNVTWTEKFL